MKRPLFLLLLCFSLSACGGRDSETGSDAAAASVPTAASRPADVMVDLKYTYPQGYGDADIRLVENAITSLAAQCRNVFYHADKISKLDGELVPAEQQEASDYGWNRVVQVQMDLADDPVFGEAKGNHCYFRVGDGTKSGVRGKSACVVAACGTEGTVVAKDGGRFHPLVQVPAINEKRKPFQMKVNQLDAAALTKGLAVGSREIGTGDSGAKRLRWAIKGTEQGFLEAVGHDAGDLQNFGMQCMTFDKEGNSAGWPEGSVCRTIFKKVLSRVITQSDAEAENMIRNAGLFPPRSSAPEVRLYRKGFEIDLEHSGFFMIRKRATS